MGNGILLALLIYIYLSFYIRETYIYITMSVVLVQFRKLCDVSQWYCVLLRDIAVVLEK